MLDRGNLWAIVNEWSKATILCIGDVMLDRFVYGAVKRISPEAPIPILRIDREELMLGGAGNVARNISSINAHAIFVSVVGNDVAGRHIDELLIAEKRVAPHLLTECDHLTTEKMRFIAGSYQLLRADTESSKSIQPATELSILEVCMANLPASSIVVLSDYGKGLLTPFLIRNIIDAARAAGKPVIVDPKGRDYSRYRGATVLTPNRAELAEAVGMTIDSDESVVAAARLLIENYSIENIVVTRSEDGITLVDNNGGVVHIPAIAREVFDVSGAGDTVVAVLAAGMAANATLPEAASLANAAAGLVVGKVGTAVVHADEILRELMVEQAIHDYRKVINYEEALAKVARWRCMGQRIGFTNGCFDLIHPGHISLLNQARRACNRLIIGLNSDSSVKRLKGPHRPIQNEQARATVLSSLSSVDLVVLFDEDTPLNLIEAIRPDILVKGSDYSIDAVVGADFVRSYGGKVILADLIPEQSTTQIVHKMRIPSLSSVSDLVEKSACR